MKHVDFLMESAVRPQARRLSSSSENAKDPVVVYLLIGVIGILVLLAFLVLILIIVCWRKKNAFVEGPSSQYLNPATNSRPPPSGAGVDDAGPPVISSASLTSKQLTRVANDFAVTIGSSARCIVYKGEARDIGQVAVKLLSSPVPPKKFVIVVDFCRILHPNLVRLIACCGDGIQALVYEYVSNGTLRYHLQGDRTNAVPLSWPQRINILLGTAKAINYLHSHPWTVVHGSITSGNILLDANLVPKLSDTGIAQLFLKDAGQQTLMTTVYMDLDYYQNGVTTFETDIYSLGIVMLETLSGQPPRVPKMDGRGHSDSILAWAKNLILAENLDSFLDKRYLDFENINREAALTIAQRAIQCCERQRTRRPSMSEIIESLEKVADQPYVAGHS